MSTSTAAHRSHTEQSVPDDRPVVLSTHGLTKDFRKLRAVDTLDLQVRRGEVFGFLGPNGAGKSTTIRLIFGLLYPTRGHVEILGHKVPQDRREALRHVGGFVDDPSFYRNLTARQNLHILGGIHDRVTDERVDEVLEIVGLTDRSGSKVGGYSHGMRQRLGIALALVHKPELIILDEPTSGLDPQGMKDVRELVRELGRQGTTVFLSSHLLHEVELVCDHAAILHKGQRMAHGPVSALRPPSDTVRILTPDPVHAAESLNSLSTVADISKGEDYLVLKADQDQIPGIVRQLVAEGVDVQGVIPAAQQGLEEVFLGLTGSDPAGEA